MYNSIHYGLTLHGFQVNGDTVTFCLEVKSTRERATPDKAVWGYSVIVAADQVRLLFENIRSLTA